MSKIRNLYYFFVIEVFIIWCFFTFEITDIKLNVTFLKELSPIISACAATINLIFVITIFRSNKNDKKKDDDLSKISYWYRNIIIDKSIELISERFNKIKIITKDLTPSKCYPRKLTQIFEKYKIEKRSLIQNVNDMIRILDTDFADALDIFLDDYEDLYTEKVEDLFSSKDNASEWDIKFQSLESLILEQKQQYIKKLYEYERNGYT